MPTQIDYYGSLSSPWTYFGHQRLCGLAKKYNAKINFFPVEFSVVFAATGGLPLPKRSPERRAYRYMELKRWKKKLDLPLNLDPKFFPVPHTKAALMCMAAEKTGADNLALAGKYLDAVWCEEKDITDDQTVIEIANELGLEGNLLFEKSQTLVAEYGSLADEAISKGIFGAPSYVIDGEIFWGQDRMEFVEEKLKEANE